MSLSRLASPAALVWLLGGVLLAFFLYLIVTVGRIETAVPNHDAVAVCIEKHKATTGVTTVSVGDLYGLNGFCYDTIGSQLKIDQEKIRRDNFLFQRNENVVLHHADDGVIVEFDLLGTHEGELRGIPPTGKSFRCRMVAFFLFEDGGDRITCERIYFDQATIAQQLLGDGG